MRTVLLCLIMVACSDGYTLDAATDASATIDAPVPVDAHEIDAPAELDAAPADAPRDGYSGPLGFPHVVTSTTARSCRDVCGHLRCVAKCQFSVGTKFAQTAWYGPYLPCWSDPDAGIPEVCVYDGYQTEDCNAVPAPLQPPQDGTMAFHHEDCCCEP